MREVSNNTVMVALIIALVLSLGGSAVVLTKISSFRDMMHPTGFATDGYVKIAINETLRLNVTVDTIDFGTCDIAGLSSIQSINSEWSNTDISTNTDITCNSSTLPDNLTVANTGNAPFNLTLRSDATGTDLLNSTNADLSFRATEIDASCTGIGGTLTDTYTTIANNATDYQVCTNMTYGNPSPTVALWANFTIPTDASTSGSEAQATLTFTAQSVNG